MINPLIYKLNDGHENNFEPFMFLTFKSFIVIDPNYIVITSS